MSGVDYDAVVAELGETDRFLLTAHEGPDGEVVQKLRVRDLQAKCLAAGADVEAGDRVDVVVVRQGKEVKASVELTTRP